MLAHKRCTCVHSTQTRPTISQWLAHTHAYSRTHTHQQQLIANIHMYYTQYFIHTHTHTHTHTQRNWYQQACTGRGFLLKINDLPDWSWLCRSGQPVSVCVYIHKPSHATYAPTCDNRRGRVVGRSYFNNNDMYTLYYTHKVLIIMWTYVAYSNF